MSCHFLLACRVLVEKSSGNLMGVPLYVICNFSLVARSTPRSMDLSNNSQTQCGEKLDFPEKFMTFEIMSVQFKFPPAQSP